MPSILEFAELSSEVYNSIPKDVGEWKMSIARVKWLSGELQAAVYTKNRQTIVAFKGTSGGMDVVADIKLGLCMNTSYYRKAEEFVAQNAPAGAYLTGHSLGGAIAQAVGHRHNMPFVTFNAPGVALSPTFNTGSVFRNLTQLNPIMAVGRLYGAAYGGLRHPNQTDRDYNAFANVDRGINYRLYGDQVSNLGIHRGKVTTISGKGIPWGVGARHKMKHLITALHNTGKATEQFH